MKCNLRLQYGTGFCDSVAALVVENPVAAKPWRCGGADKMRGNFGEELDGVVNKAQPRCPVCGRSSAVENNSGTANEGGIKFFAGEEILYLARQHDVVLT
ncbi:MAG: hypothetical protein WCH84_06555 [Verrucomicrobiota bacterium]